MRKFLIGFLSILILPSFVGAAEVRTDPSIEVTAGIIEQDGMLGSSGGEIFLEFSDGVRFLNAGDRTMFSGEILPPAVIPLPTMSPRTRMDELLTFELVADTGTEVAFADAFDTLHPRNQLREQYLNPDLQRDGWVQLLMPIEDELVQEPKLWEFVGEREGWIRIGGRMEPTEYDDVFIFIAKISRTGVYGVFDEDPLPSTYATDWEVLTEPESAHDPAGVDFEPEVLIPAFISDDPTLEYAEETDADFMVDVNSPTVGTTSERQVPAIAPLANQKISPMSPNYGDPSFFPIAAPVVTLTNPTLEGGAIDLDYTPGTGSTSGDGGAVTLLDTPDVGDSSEMSNPLTAPDLEELSPPPGSTLPSTGVLDDGGESASGWMIVVLAGVVVVLAASVVLAFKKPGHQA